MGTQKGGFSELSVQACGPRPGLEERQVPPGQESKWGSCTDVPTLRSLQVPLTTKQNLMPPSLTSGRTRRAWHSGTPGSSGLGYGGWESWPSPLACFCAEPLAPPSTPGAPAPCTPPTNSHCWKQTQRRGGAHQAGNARAPGTQSASGRGGWGVPSP